MCKMRPLFICSLSLLLLLTFAGMAAATPAASESEVTVSAFSDVDKNDVNALYITFMAKKGFISGFPDGSFHPGEGLTRAQAATILCRIKGLKPEMTAQPTFGDVAGSHWAAHYINAASQAGYITGFPDNTYQPEAELTRAQGISLFLRLAGQNTNEELPLFEDMDKNHWAASSMATAVAAGMITADGNKIKPEQAFSRGDLAKALAVLITKDPGLSQNQLLGRLEVKNGDVRLKKAGDKARSISKTAIVNIGDTVITGKDGEAEINYPDGSGLLLKPNTEIIIKEAWGRAYIKHDGAPANAVDNLEIELKTGKIFGALASKYIASAGENQIAENKKYTLVASREAVFDWLAAKDSEKWYKTADKKKVKVKVDMPWGVAAIRGSFWSNTVSGSGCGMTLLEGDGDLTNGGQTQNLSPGQTSGINNQGGPPSPPGPMSPSEAGEWSQQRSWVTNRASDMQNNQEAPPGTPPGSQPGNEPGHPGNNPMDNLMNNLNNALNQAGTIAGTQPGNSSSSGSSGSGGNDTVAQAAAPIASPGTGSYADAQTVVLSTTTTGAAIYYTTDGSDPKTSSNRVLYTTPISITASITIKAYATKSGMSNSTVATFAYTIGLSSPVNSVNTNGSSIIIRFNTAVSNAYIDETGAWYPVVTLNDGNSYKVWVVDGQGNYSLCLHEVEFADDTVYVATEGGTPGITYYLTVYSGPQYTESVYSTSFTPAGSSTTIGKVHPRLAYNPQPEYKDHLMVYEKHNGTNSAICGQIVSSGGALIGNEFVISPAGENWEPTVAFDMNSNYLVLWSDRCNNPAIRGQVVNPGGNLVGDSFIVYSNGSNLQFKPSLALSENGFLAVWQDGDSTFGSDIMGRLINFSGNTPDMEDPIPFSQAEGSQYDPVVAYNNGEYLVVFADGDDLKGSLINWDGTLIDTATITSANGAKNAAVCAVENNDNYKFLVTWQDQQSGNYDITARFVGTEWVNDNECLTLGENMNITDSPNQETCPTVASYNSYYLLAWQDRSLDNDIKARILYPDGTPAGSVCSISAITGEEMYPVMPSNNGGKTVLAWENQVSSPYQISLNPFKESPPLKAEWILVTNNATGDDEITTERLPMVIPAGTAVTVYDSSGSCLGSGVAAILGSDGYFPPLIEMEGGFSPDLMSVDVKMTLPGNNESESTNVELPIPVMNENHDFTVDNCDYGYGKITYIITPSQVAAIEAATGKAIATVKAYTTPEQDSHFANLTDAEAIGSGIEIPVTDDDDDTNDYVSVNREPGCYGYAIAAYDASDQVVACFVQSAGYAIVYAP